MIEFDKDCYADRWSDLAPEIPSTGDGSLDGRSSESTQTQTPAEIAWLFATSNDAFQPQTFDLRGLWHELCAGTWRFRDTFSTAERHFAVVECVSVSKQPPLNARNRDMLTRVLLGQIPKAVAHDMSVAISTVATGMQECLRRMGAPCRASSAPVLLVMAARAAACPGSPPIFGRLTRISAKQDRYWLVSVERCDLRFPVALSQAEADVIRQLVSGQTYAEISQCRARSPRTIANQLSSAFKKLGVSGRGAVLERLISHYIKDQSALDRAGGASPA